MNIPSGKISDISSQLLNDRYDIGSIIHAGTNSCVFKCTDISKKHSKKLVVKIFE